MFPKRAQTATEYLVILSVVIVIAVIVISILGGIPLIGGGVDKQTNDLALSTAAVGVTSYSISDYKTKLFVRNNKGSSITVTGISVNGEVCADIDDFLLIGGKTKEIDCVNVFEYESDSAELS